MRTMYCRFQINLTVVFAKYNVSAVFIHTTSKEKKVWSSSKLFTVLHESLKCCQHIIVYSNVFHFKVNKEGRDLKTSDYCRSTFLLIKIQLHMASHLTKVDIVQVKSLPPNNWSMKKLMLCFILPLRLQSIQNVFKQTTLTNISNPFDK